MHFIIKQVTAVCFAAIATLTGSAQKFDISWGDNAKLKYDFEDAVPVGNGQLIVLKLKAVARSLFGGNVEQQPILVLVDKNMNVLVEKDLPIQ